jgi:hypothetical protein
MGGGTMIVEFTCWMIGFFICEGKIKLLDWIKFSIVGNIVTTTTSMPFKSSQNLVYINALLMLTQLLDFVL